MPSSCSESGEAMSYTSIMNQKLAGWCWSLWCKDLIEITLSITTLVGWYKNSFNCGGPAVTLLCIDFTFNRPEIFNQYMGNRK